MYLKFVTGAILIISAQICTTLARRDPCKCYKIYAPVCGSDGKTYGNECALDCEAYETGEDIDVVKDGVCKGFWSTRRGGKERDCGCPDIFNPICGSDDVTYANWCEFDCAKADSPFLTLMHEGSCRSS